ncbi:MAG: P-loop NTPase [Alphaproteobacteria bacterium]|nr:P-loop NTPase [Alphaproteobacteria bacterium]
MASTEQKIREALRAVRDPRQDAPRDVHEHVESLLITGNKMTCVLRGANDLILRKAVEQTLREAAPSMQVLVVVSQEFPQAPAKPAKSEIDPAAGIQNIKHIVAVASGKGGVGKSTVAVNLAVTLAQSGLRVGLLDADIYGPSIPIMLGVQQRPESPDGKMMIPVQAHGLSTLSIGYMLANQDPVVWRGPMVHSALKQMLGQSLWGALDILLIDMPPGTGDVALTLVQRGRLSGAIIVTTPQNVALADARKGIGMFRKVNVPILGVIENMAFHKCPNCATHTAIFGSGGGEAEARTQSVPFLGGLPLQPEVCQHADAGTPIVLQSKIYQKYFDGIAEKLLNQLDRLSRP